MCLACHLRLRARTAFAIGATPGCALCGCTAPTVFAGRHRIVIRGTAVPAALTTPKVELEGDRDAPAATAAGALP